MYYALKADNQFVFAVDMGDLFGDWVPSEWILNVLETIKQKPASNFLFLTKNPKRYFEYLAKFPLSHMRRDYYE